MKPFRGIVWFNIMSAMAIFIIFPVIGQSLPSADTSAVRPEAALDQPILTEGPIFLSPVALRQVQQQLIRRGHDAGPTDGTWGISTAVAVKNFQKARNLVPTGNLNIETIRALDLTILLDGRFDESWIVVGQRQQQTVNRGVQLYIGPAELQKIQENLLQQGFEAGPPDGVWGENTRQAVLRFQQEKGLKADGHINIDLLTSLSMKQVVAALGLDDNGFSGKEQMTAAARSKGRLPEHPAITPRNGRNTDHVVATGTGNQPDRSETDEEQAMRGYFRAKIDKSQIQPQPTGLRGAGVPLFAGSAIIRQVQQALKDAGHDPGPMDGQWNASIEQALYSYQWAEHLSLTGSLTLATLQKLVGGRILQGPGGPIHRNE